MSEGALIGVFPEARQIVEKAIEKVLQKQAEPKQAEPKQALDEAVKSINSALEKYNQTIGK
ncbi:hypothetical protein ACETAC_09610 [Aceticella autotrophica]|uniref:Uncharacterized protein n=1 Tax=Aceticella autotrophica TaxID=2755338 RepID=A0A975AVA7_9THEO|nr:hypothetical protein [Aceticella autotrophica]QSZ27106.1 hypothetical protein ACETAC_09610 [Aceticella autotrophica]